MNGKRYSWMDYIFFAWTAAVLTCHVFYKTSYSSWLWCCSTWNAFDPPSKTILYGSGIILVIIVFLSRNRLYISLRAGGLAPDISSCHLFKKTDWIFLPCIFIVFYLFRSRVFYGDANVNFYRGIYANFLTYQVFHVFTLLTKRFHVSDLQIIATMSSACGIMYFLGIRSLTGLFATGGIQKLIMGFLLTILPVQLFFGYIEVYFTLACILPFYLRAGVLFIRGHITVFIPAAWMGIALLFHLSAGWLLLSFGFLLLLDKKNHSWADWLRRMISVTGIFTALFIVTQITIFVTVYDLNWQKIAWDYTHTSEERTFRSLGGGGDQRIGTHNRRRHHG